MVLKCLISAYTHVCTYIKSYAYVATYCNKIIDTQIQYTYKGVKKGTFCNHATKIL